MSTDSSDPNSPGFVPSPAQLATVDRKHAAARDALDRLIRKAAEGDLDPEHPPFVALTLLVGDEVARMTSRHDFMARGRVLAGRRGCHASSPDLRQSTRHRSERVMARLMSVSLTEQAVVERRKDVTRRLGWKFARPGDPVTLCRKVMGRRRSDGTVEPLVRLAEIVVVSARRELLASVTDADVEREGFPGWDRWTFIDFFCEHMRCHPVDEVTRIEWRYVDGSA